MKAEPFYMFKRGYENGDIIEIKIWRVEQSKDKPHGFKYTLAFIKDGKRVIGYDNGEHKGDHRHYRDREVKYSFRGIENLIRDFFEDVRRAKHEGKKH